MRAECLVLEPVTLRLEVVRNLSSAWYHDHPDVEIRAVLQNFSVGILKQVLFRTILIVVIVLLPVLNFCWLINPTPHQPKMLGQLCCENKVL